MRHAFQQLPILREMLADVSCAPVQRLRDKMGEFSELRELLERAIIDAPPVLVRDGGVIAPGYHEELDEWRALADGATDYLDKLEIRERERLGLDTLKVGYNAVHGYYIQISRGQSQHAPIHYVRRQTLKNAERYIIPELKEYEDKVLTSKGKRWRWRNSSTSSCSICCCRTLPTFSKAPARWRNWMYWLTSPNARKP
jgi:DNA mismatch repair protein MutS